MRKYMRNKRIQRFLAIEYDADLIEKIEVKKYK